MVSIAPPSTQHGQDFFFSDDESYVFIWFD